MTYIPMPIVIPSSSGGSNAEYVYPFLPQLITAAGGIGALIGACVMLIFFLAKIWDRKTVEDKWMKLSVSLLICSLMVLIIGVVLLAITGEPIESGGE